MAPGILADDGGVSVVAPKTSVAAVKRPLLEENEASHDIVLKTFRLLIADLCQQYNGGHPGHGRHRRRPLEVRDALRPHTPTFFNRDRFVLSNGHTCLFQYAFLHLTGYKAMTFDQLKSYHSDRVDAFAPATPRSSTRASRSPRDPWARARGGARGDFLAGHFKLNNLTIIYDNNQITCDGSVDLTNTEDVNAKMRASGWDVLDIEDGCFDIHGLVAALDAARTTATKPTFINVRTVIGLGSKAAGTADAHGAAFGTGDVADMKRAHGFDPEAHFVVGDEVRRFFDEIPARGEAHVREWEALVGRYEAAHPDLGASFRDRVAGKLSPRWRELIPAPGSFPTGATATRAASGLVLNPIAKELDNFMVGTADLSPSVHMIWPGKVDFQHPDLKTGCGINGNYTGRYIHYGIREHAMCAIANGLAAYNTGTIIPVTSSFFMFYLYAAPAVRMGALQHLKRGDGGRLTAALAAEGTPTIVSTSRHKVPQLAGTSREGVLRGAYVLRENPAATLTLVGVGAELSHAVGVADRLRERGVEARVVSFPSWRLFEAQPLEYRREVLQRHRLPAVVIEPYAANGWGATRMRARV
ncbi:unnamed protein product [Parascedosporium putredinis]|uniref:Transketolase-like pyrimidine-binding domain-containing protein n=1 Tax=Parascedosporium putredinis TaxID=1442378 RepID=A0A9P1H416_9PEZI|nr:unnamed protein product [Parascedosporium putredinis]CAI7996319.1 unnamed protein product [Parascedosporium putredinis]